MYKQMAADKAHAEAILTATYNGRPPARELELYRSDTPNAPS